jgi:hypothetical protein
MPGYARLSINTRNLTQSFITVTAEVYILTEGAG